MHGHHPHNTQCGFTMIEVLVALIVLSIGLLGLAGLQNVGLHANHSAYMRTQATLLAYDMADRMRANYLGVIAGNYNNLGPATPATPSNTCNNAVNTCTAAQIATLDYYQWERDITNVLPTGAGTVVKNNVAGTSFTITVMWDDLHTGATGTGCSGNANVDLTCLSISTRPF